MAPQRRTILSINLGGEKVEGKMYGIGSSGLFITSFCPMQENSVSFEPPVNGSIKGDVTSSSDRNEISVVVSDTEPKSGFGCQSVCTLVIHLS